MVTVDTALPEPAPVAVDEIGIGAGVRLTILAAATGRPGTIVFDLHAPERALRPLFIDDAEHHVEPLGVGIVHFHVPHGTHGAEPYRRLGRDGCDSVDEGTVGITAPARKTSGEAQDDLAVDIVSKSLRRHAD